MAAVFVWQPGGTAQSATPKAPIRLYVFDNGVIAGGDPAAFGFRRNELATVAMSVASYLVVHPKGTLQWDTGVIADVAVKSGRASIQRGASSITVMKTLESQLAGAGYRAAEIDYLALSHRHFDHTANVDAFARAIWLVQKNERDAMIERISSKSTSYSALKNSRTRILTGEDCDVFGDGAVVIKAAYGHTAGHQVLFVRLAKDGPVLLAGDLYHHPEERGTGKVPAFEFNKEQSLASRAAIEAFIRATGAQLWIGHDLMQFRTIRKAPEYYE
jgi:glyoxylase-like metal-dependent hydrolase (beta-lactamase superfamily II)